MAQRSANEETEAIISKIAAGDQPSLTALYDRTSRQVFGLIRSTLADPGVAEEVLLDVYTQAWKQAPAYDPNRSTALAWLSMIAGARAVERSGTNPPEAEPPDYLRDLLVARVERESQEAPVRTLVAKDERQAAEPRKAGAIPRAPVFAPAPQERSRLPWLIAAAFALAAGILLFAWKQAGDSMKQLDDRLSQAQADTINLRALLEAQRGRSRELDQIIAAISARGTRLINLQTQPPSPAASIAIFWDTEKNRWLTVGFLPPPPEGKVYQLWFTTAQASIAAGLMQADPLGHVFATIEVPQGAVKITGGAITLEPEGGSKQPTPPFLAVGRAT